MGEFPILTVLWVALVYLVARICAYKLLHATLKEIKRVTTRMDDIYKAVGNTVGQIRDSGNQPEHYALWKKGGKYYRRAVILAAFLMYWPIGVFFLKRKMLAAYDKVGLFTGAVGSYNAYQDVRRGFAYDTDYYPRKHLDGLAASLGVAPLI